MFESHIIVTICAEREGTRKQSARQFPLTGRRGEASIATEGDYMRVWTGGEGGCFGSSSPFLLRLRLRFEHVFVIDRSVV